jgi:hypothetical protein
MHDKVPLSKQEADAGSGSDPASASFDAGLMIYGMVSGPVAVGAGYLTLRLSGSGITAVVASAVLVLAAGCCADPVLRRLRPLAPPGPASDNHRRSGRRR